MLKPNSDSFILKKDSGRITGLFEIIARGDARSKFKVGDKVVCRNALTFCSIRDEKDIYKSETFFFCKTHEIYAKLEEEEE